MNVSACWFGMEFDFNLEPPSLSFSFGPTTVDDEPEVEPDRRGDSVSIPIGYAPSPQPDWEKPLNRYDEPSEGDEDV